MEIWVFLVFLVFFCDWGNGSPKNSREVIIVAGNFTIDGDHVNIGLYDIESGKHNSALYVYGDSNGVIWDVAVNDSGQYGKLLVGGTFDTISRKSQIQYCSFGKFDGNALDKVGEGLCPRGGGIETHLNIYTTTIGSNGNVFVGGNFETTVWGGAGFVEINHVAMFDAAAGSWLPLRGGKLRTVNSEVIRVNSMGWDAERRVLYIGGLFHAIDEEIVTSGLAVWSEQQGLRSFPSGSSLVRGITTVDNSVAGTYVKSLAFEPRAKSLFVAGLFAKVNGVDCSSIAVWHRDSVTWRCLADPQYLVSPPSSMLLSDRTLLVAGWADAKSTWSSHEGVPYAVAMLDIGGYVDENTLYFDDDVSANASAKVLRVRETEVAAKISATSKGAPSHSPTPAPPWVVSWKWLPEFCGANGPILRMYQGKGSLSGFLFISGAFNNYPSVISYRWEGSDSSSTKKSGKGHDSEEGNNPLFDISPDENNIIEIVGVHVIEGLISSVVQVTLPLDPNDQPIEPARAEHNHNLLIFTTCVVTGVVIGLGIAVRCLSGGYKSLPLGGDHSFEYQGSELSRSGIPLTTLSGGGRGAPSAVDLQECYERAMASRHLPSDESLKMINPKEIVLSKVIGEGSFGRVWSGQWKYKPVAVKEFIFAQAAIAGGSVQRNGIIEEIVGEAGIMSCLRHPKILELYGCSLTMQAIWIVSELCVRGSLRMVLTDRSFALTLAKKLSICLDIADGMNYLHCRTPPLIHRDLKSHNIFITESSPGHFVGKIGDWGSARAIALTGAKSMTHGVGTACWLSPEVINNAHYSKASDIYAYGIVLWEIFTRQEVYEGYSAAQIIAKVAHEELRPLVPRNCPWAGLMLECWKQNSSERPDFQHVLLVLSKIYSRIIKIDDTEDDEESNFLDLSTAEEVDAIRTAAFNASPLKAKSTSRSNSRNKLDEEERRLLMEEFRPTMDYYSEEEEPLFRRSPVKERSQNIIPFSSHSSSNPVQVKPRASAIAQMQQCQSSPSSKESDSLLITKVADSIPVKFGTPDTEVGVEKRGDDSYIPDPMGFIFKGRK